MRKLLLCVPMITLMLLCACQGGGAGGNQAEELSLAIRGEYLEMERCTANAAVTADYGQRVYEYQLAVAVEGEQTVLTLSAPDTVAGITARLKGTDSLLEYDGLSLDTGPLDKDGLTPVSAIPTMLETAKSGYITACSIEEEDTLLRMDCGAVQGTPGEGVVTSLWFDLDSYSLVRGEIYADGFRVIACEFTNFIRG